MRFLIGACETICRDNPLLAFSLKNRYCITVIPDKNFFTFLNGFPMSSRIIDETVKTAIKRNGGF